MEEMESTKKNQEMKDNVNTSEAMALVSEADSLTSTPNTMGGSEEGSAAQLIQGNSQLEGTAARDPAASGSKMKRPKSPQTSSSSGSVISNPTTAAEAEVRETEVILTNSLEAMSVLDAASPVAEGKSKKKRKKKKKSKSGQSVAESPDLKIEDGTVNKNEGSKSGGDWWKRKQAPPLGSGVVNIDDLLDNKPESNSNSSGWKPKTMMENDRDTAEEGIGSGRGREQLSAQAGEGSSLQHFSQNPQSQQQVEQRQHVAPPRPMLQQHGQREQQQQEANQGQKHKKCHQKPEPRQQQQQQQQQRQQQGQNTKTGGHKKHHSHKKDFEPYWPRERVSEGLKRGTLIEGPIRINQKNYEDAYVPLPDGKADIFISGMADRNRALNGDVVAVLIHERQDWRVFTEEVDYYEKSNTPLKTEGAAGTDSDTEMVDASNEKSAENEKEVYSGMKDVDVLVEEEEVVELDEFGNPIEGTLVVRQVTGSEATPVQAATTPVGTKGARGAMKDQGQSSSPGKAQRFKSVKDVLDQASPVVRKLFDRDGFGGGGQEEGEEGSGIRADKFIQRTGKVVAIIGMRHSRACSGNLSALKDPGHSFVTFVPMDSRVPRIMIPVADLPEGFKERPDDFTKILYIARIVEWNEKCKMPKGTLARSLGEAGQLEPETEALLAENNIDSSDFKPEVLACLPQELPWTIPAKELEWRRDLRQECIFTIDPTTARDLDDALHCTDLGDGVYEVGVHIADVSYFVEEHTELDNIARQKSTSVYLVQKVIPMLPRLLCEQLCSLNPGEDRLSFSVIWKITQEGQILEEWFGRTIIRSCVKLSYEHAQGFIEEPDREWTVEELPPLSGGFTVNDIKTRVLQMDRIAKSLRKERFDGGALRLDQVKIQFTLNKESGLPDGYFVYEQRDSNKLVEEFMLLANMAVAHKIRNAHREKAVLRRHPPPQTRMVLDLKELCDSLGFPIQIESSKDIQMSLKRYAGDDELSQARLQILVHLCSRPMRNAKYFCCGMLPDETLYSHYALNVPLYTHFTSPIRRYPDILVHRTLAAALGYCEVTDRTSALLHEIAEHCNDMKTNAKACSDKSNELYFAVYVKEAGPLEAKGMVMQVLDKSFDVFILKLGVVKRVYCERLPLETYSHHKEGKRIQQLTLVWKAHNSCPQELTQRLTIFSPVNCLLKSEPEPLKWSAFILQPVVGDPTIVK